MHEKEPNFIDTIPEPKLIPIPNPLAQHPPCGNSTSAWSYPEAPEPYENKGSDTELTNPHDERLIDRVRNRLKETSLARKATAGLAIATLAVGASGEIANASAGNRDTTEAPIPEFTDYQLEKMCVDSMDYMISVNRTSMNRKHIVKFNRLPVHMSAEYFGEEGWTEVPGVNCEDYGDMTARVYVVSTRKIPTGSINLNNLVKASNIKKFGNSEMQNPLKGKVKMKNWWTPTGKKFGMTLDRPTYIKSEYTYQSDTYPELNNKASFFQELSLPNK